MGSRRMVIALHEFGEKNLFLKILRFAQEGRNAVLYTLKLTVSRGLFFRTSCDTARLLLEKLIFQALVESVGV